MGERIGRQGIPFVFSFLLPSLPPSLVLSLVTSLPGLLQTQDVDKEMTEERNESRMNGDGEAMDTARRKKPWEREGN